MNTAARTKSKFFEGGNVAAVIVAPLMFVGALYFYDRLVQAINPLGILIEDVYTYTFNLYAIELGALLALFALFACRPTPFLERMKTTATFAAIVANTNITLVLGVTTLLATFVLGLLRFPPHDIVDMHTVVFIGWCSLVIGTTSVYVRTVRLMLTALA
jgi:hypothetical protein